VCVLTIPYIKLKEMTITQKHVFKAQTKRVNANTDATQSKGLRHINVVQKAM
jgi:hypothetical protein